MPPTQWVKLLQNSMDLSSTSMSVRMLEPVVVNPETVSKKASTKLGICLLITKGRQPKRLSIIQDRPTMANPSRAYTLLPSDLTRMRAPPAAAAAHAEIRNARKDSCSW